MARKMVKTNRVLEREQLHSAINDFLARGGRIKNVSHYDSSISPNNTSLGEDAYSYFDFDSPIDDTTHFASRKGRRFNDFE